MVGFVEGSGLWGRGWVVGGVVVNRRGCVYGEVV